MSAVDDFVMESATSYLQSVVFVDDKIYESAGGKPLENSPVAIDFGGGLRPQFGNDGADDTGGSAKAAPVVTIAQSDAPDGRPAITKAPSDLGQQIILSQYHPRELMESFAQKGIVCALYEPRNGFKTDPASDLFRLCERADVVILDWDLYNDDGDAVSELLAELIKKSEAEFPHHVRLCTLYTNRPSLHPVMDLLLAKLTGRGCSVDVAHGKLQLTCGATRIVIFGKPVTVGRPGDDTPYEVKESELAERVIAEFASLHHGVMPAFALRGLAAVRRNTKRLLNKFRTDLDGPFLLHRALTLEDGDAFDELPELLSDEIRAVLEDAWPVGVPIQDIASAAVDSLQLREPDPPWTTTTGVPYIAAPIFREVLKKGEAGLDGARPECKEASEFKKNKGFRGAKPARLKDFEGMLTVDGKVGSEHLAALFCTRTQYGPDSRVLRFGTIIRHRPKTDEAWIYSLCLMPICDSQRLAKACAFPFWKLKENVKEGLPGRRFGSAVIDSEDVAHCLAAGGKIREMLWMAEFTPTKGNVVATRSAQGFRFEHCDLIVEWIAELKPLHAQRVAAHIGSEIARVGLVESEWLRLFCDR
jgi:hypothetical protein